MVPSPHHLRTRTEAERQARPAPDHLVHPHEIQESGEGRTSQDSPGPCREQPAVCLFHPRGDRRPQDAAFGDHPFPLYLGQGDISSYRGAGQGNGGFHQGLFRGR